MLDILVIGGGIGGLSSALGLARLGFSVHVLDRGFRDSGTAIQLGPNALDCLHRLGILEACPIYYPSHLRIIDGRLGREVGYFSFAVLRETFGYGWGVVKRSDLHGALLSACAAHDGIRIETPVLIEDVGEDGDCVYARSSDGVYYEGIGLIGADGFHSRIRDRLYPVLGDGVYRRHHELICRRSIPVSAFPVSCAGTDVTLHLYRGGHIVHYPLGVDMDKRNMVVCFSPVVDAPLLRDVSGVCSSSDMVESLPAESATLGHFLSSFDGADSWRFWRAADIVLDRFDRGRFLLLGDAAHGILPHLSQGGAMALEDGYALYHLGVLKGYESVSACLRADVIGDLFSAFNAFRFRRIGMVRRLSHQARHPWHLGGLGSFFRNRFLNITSDRMFFYFLSDIYRSSFK